MPAMADITVFKNDGVTNVIYVAKSPSAGDTVPAVWRFDGATPAYVGLKPEYRMLTKWNGNRSARRAEMTGVYSSVVTDSTTTIQSSIGKIVFDVSVAMPQSIPQADIDEAVSQFSNMLNSTLVRSCLKAGFAPT